MKTSYAHGGMTEHGLKLNDTIKSGGGIGKTTVRVHNSNFGDARVDLDKGKRTPLEFNRKTKKYEEKLAKGGETKERGALSKREKDFIKEELKNGKGQGFSYKAKILHGQEVVIRSKNGTPIKKWAFDNFKIALKIAMKLNKESNIQDGYMAKGGKTKKGKKEPMVVRGFFEDEPYEYGGGGAIYKGDKVRIKDTNKSMVVKNIAKGKKGYVEFTGDKGTYLKGDLEKFEDGGEVGSDNYKVVKVFRKSGRKVVLEKWLTREEAMRVVARYPNSNTSMVIFTKMFEEGGMTSGWCYSIGGL